MKVEDYFGRDWQDDVFSDWRHISCLLRSHLRKTDFPRTKDAKTRFCNALIFLGNAAKDYDDFARLSRAARESINLIMEV